MEMKFYNKNAKDLYELADTAEQEEALDKLFAFPKTGKPWKKDGFKKWTSVI